MSHSLSLVLALAALVGLSACDAVPNAKASAGEEDLAPFILRDGMMVESDGDAVRMTVDGERVTLKAIEMFALTQVAQRAAWDALTEEQRDIYLAGKPFAEGRGKGGDRCFPNPDGDWTFSGIRGGGDPCPPPPPRSLDRDLANLFYGDYFDLGEHPGEKADWEQAAGGLIYR